MLNWTVLTMNMIAMTVRLAARDGLGPCGPRRLWGRCTSG
jgi:hypothetical protein